MRSFLLATLFVLSSAAAHAQVSKGLNELRGSFDLSASDGNTVIELDAFYGFFLTDRFELGPLISLEDAGATALYLGGEAAYHFGQPGATTVPFVGGRLAVGLADADGFVIGGIGGAKFFIVPGAAITPAAKLLIVDSDGGSDTIFGGEIGISIFF